MDIKTSGELTGILDMLKLMAKFETKIAELYSHCAAAWAEDKEFWLSIWRDEIRHARHIEQMMDAIRKNPRTFEVGRVYNKHSMEMIVKDIEEKVQMIIHGEITKDQLLFIAQSLEQQYMEEKYSEIVVTEDPGYNRFMQEIMTDTQQHKDKIIQQIIERAQNKGYIKDN
ncbi:MAG: hypothetical protein ABFD12_01630 [Syntrophorhabdus sp.]